MNNTNIKTILKHPFIGTSLNLIETFLIVGYDTNEILLSISKTTKQKLAFSNKSSYEYKKQRLIEEIYPTESKRRGDGWSKTAIRHHYFYNNNLNKFI